MDLVARIQHDGKKTCYKIGCIVARYSLIIFSCCTNFRTQLFYMLIKNVIFSNCDLLNF